MPSGSFTSKRLTGGFETSSGSSLKGTEAVTLTPVGLSALALVGAIETSGSNSAWEAAQSVKLSGRS